jgi:hypothetical protein
VRLPQSLTPSRSRAARHDEATAGERGLGEVEGAGVDEDRVATLLTKSAGTRNNLCRKLVS